VEVKAMSRLYKQVREITRFLRARNVGDADLLYEKLVSNKTKKIPCFRKRKINYQKGSVSDEDIDKEEFRRIVQFMDEVDLLNREPISLTDANREALEDNKEETFKNLLEEIIKEYFAEHQLDLSILRKDIIGKIKYPSIRNPATIRKEVEKTIKPKRMISLQDFCKLLTLLSDIGLLERRSSTLYL